MNIRKLRKFEIDLGTMDINYRPADGRCDRKMFRYLWTTIDELRIFFN